MEKKEVEKCICGAPAKLAVTEQSYFGGHVIIRDYEFYRCERGHEYLTKEQTEKIDKEFRRQYRIRRQVIETGRSLAITLPKDFADFYNLKKGSEVVLIPIRKKEAIIRFGN